MTPELKLRIITQDISNVVCGDDTISNETAAEIVVKAAVASGIPARDIEDALKRLYS